MVSKLRIICKQTVLEAYHAWLRIVLAYLHVRARRDGLGGGVLATRLAPQPVLLRLPAATLRGLVSHIRFGHHARYIYSKM